VLPGVKRCPSCDPFIRVLATVQVHPQASDKDIADLFSAHGTVTKMSKVVTISEAGPHTVGRVTLSSEAEAKVRTQTLCIFECSCRQFATKFPQSVRQQECEVPAMLQRNESDTSEGLSALCMRSLVHTML
jgi:hypothetical protein